MRNRPEIINPGHVVVNAAALTVEEVTQFVETLHALPFAAKLSGVMGDHPVQQLFAFTPEREG
jgi:hypothetical protein